MAYGNWQLTLNFYNKNLGFLLVKKKNHKIVHDSYHRIEHVVHLWVLEGPSVVK